MIQRATTLSLLLLLGACTRMMDWEALQRAMVNDKGGGQKIGVDAEPKTSYGPGDKHYLEKKGYAGNRQVHVFSNNLNRTSVLDGRALRRHARIIVIATYSGAPPPPKDWAQKRNK
jgi:hypothetical protein